MLLFIYTSIYTQQTPSTNIKSELLQEKSGEKIIIPDVKINIEDESTIPIEKQETSILKDKISNYGRIDVEELTKSKASDKFKSELSKERQKEDFSLSTFKFYYGMFNNIIAEMNTGRRSGNLNYLITYLRNKHDSLGYMNNTYFNTEMNIDDLNGDIIYSVSSNVDLSTSAGYYTREIGLYNSPINITESKNNIPARFGILYNADINTMLKGDIYYNYLYLNHKMGTNYNAKNLQEAGTTLDLETHWSRDNFLKISGKYEYSCFNEDKFHFGKISAINKMPLFSSLSIQFGLEADIYNYKGMFWAPNFMVFYKYSTVLSMKGGIYGEQNNLSTEKILNENQIDYQQTLPEEKWVYLYSIQYSPFQFINLRANVSFHQYQNYLNYEYIPETDLYVFSAISNIGVVQAEGIIELIAFENLILNASYVFRQPDYDKLLFFNYQSASIGLEYTYQPWGFSFNTRLTYRDAEKYLRDAYLDPKLIWDINMSQAISKDFYIELMLKNILNQEYFERPRVPMGGFSINAGVRILL